MSNNVMVIFKDDPAMVPGAVRLTEKEAERMASHFFYVHNHAADKPQEPFFWWRLRENYEA